MKKENLKNKRLFLFDMDGTIYLDNELFDGTLELLDFIKKSGGRYMFLTNNSSKDCTAYVEKLHSLGINAVKEDFFTSVDTAVLFLNEQCKGKKLYVFGTKSFKRQLVEEGNFKVTDILSDDIDGLIIGNDTELTFQKLEDACILLNRGVEYYATNPDWVCPTWYGYVPDCGSVCEMLFRATGRRPKFIGKPQPEMALLAMEKTGFKPEETAVMGDRLYTDIACGVNAGISSIFVLSGEGTMKDLEESEAKPAYVMKDVKEIYETIREEN